MTNKVKKFAAIAASMGTSAVLFAQSPYQWMTQEADGTITYDPGVIVGPIVTGVIAIIGSVSVFMLIRAGWNWMRSFSTKK